MVTHCVHMEAWCRMFCKRCMTSSILLIFAGIQTVSHSQYYPISDDGSSPFQSVTALRDRYFNSRNYNPSYRQHQHAYHSFNDPSGATTVKYFGTGPPSNVEVIHDYEGSGPVSEYRIRPGGRRIGPRPPPLFGVETQDGVDIALRDNEPMEVFVNLPERPFQTPPIVRIQPPDEGTSLERPPETLVVVIYRPTFPSPTCPSKNQQVLTHRRFRKDGNCYEIRTQGACGQLMIFIDERANNIYGDCVCLPDDGKVSRPLVWWPPEDRCYHLYDKGPCNYYEWLVLNDSGDAQCAPRKCPQNVNKQSGIDNTEFWFLHEGKCYKTGEHYSKFCDGPDQDSWKVWFQPGSQQPTCSKVKPIPGQTRTLLAPANDLPCRPGYKKMQNGDCKRIARFDFDY